MCCKIVKPTCLLHYTHYHVAAFFLTFFSYAMLHATRKSFSNVKTTMSAEWTPSFRTGFNHNSLTPASTWTDHNFFTSADDAEEFMGTLDASFMFAYAVGLFVSGFIADRNDLRVVLCVGMTLTSVMVFVYGCVFEWLHWYSQPAYLVVWILNGFLQSTGWPCVVTVMGNWFGKGSRGLVLGLWSACASVGNILGSVMVSAVLDYGYDYSFLVTACVLLAAALVNVCGLVPTPLEVGMALPQDPSDSDTGDENTSPNTFELESVLENGGHHGNKDPPAHLVVFRQRRDVTQHHGTDQETDITETRNNTETSNNKTVDCGRTCGNDITETSNYEKVDCCRTYENNITETSINKTVDCGRTCGNDGGHSWQGDQSSPPEEAASSPDEHEEGAHAINFFTALLLPGVVPYALCYAFLKLVNYSFFFWLPFYLSSAYSMAETVADKLSIWYDLGGVVGGTLAGFLSDRLNTRTVVVTPMLLVAVPMLFVYGMTGVAGSLSANGALLFVLGCLIGGVANLISAAISADLGRQKALKGNPKALSTVTGILDGTGSMGAALGQVAVPRMQVAFGWRTVFYLFMGCTLLTAVCIIRIFWQEARDLVRRWRHSSHHATFHTSPPTDRVTSH
ncbi:sugar phosphate exchanger 3-like [Babylonia areolata]|uniref:sugar phosphate exchanger 3-like n=1 Tax=Babylonia areolata TaxID=304850 RepID=UPI003FD681FF